MTMTFIDKEQMVIDLLKDGKNFLEISKEAHVRSILEITKKLSILSQFLKLFSEGKSVLEVTMELHKLVDEIRCYYEDYLDLKKIHDLTLLVDFHQGNILTNMRLIKHIS